LGFNLGQVFDPEFSGGTVISDLFYMLSLVIFLFLNGHHALMMAVRQSFDVLPVFTASVGAGALDVMFGLMTVCTILAMKLAAPVIVAMLITDLVLGFLAKTVPQLNIMSMGMSLRAGIGLIVLIAGLVMTSETMTGAILDSMQTVLHAFVGRAHG
jgi:flagellar biosynthesis protein FliR